MRILARTETAKPPDLKEINQIAKSIGRIGARIDAEVRHEIPSLLPETIINLMFSAMQCKHLSNAKSTHLPSKNELGGRSED